MNKRHISEMKPGEVLRLRSGHTVELERAEPVTCGIMLTFKAKQAERKEQPHER